MKVFITLKQIQGYGVSRKDVATFRGLFGDEVEVTVDNIYIILNRFNWDWMKLLLDAKYAPEFMESWGDAWKAYKKKSIFDTTYADLILANDNRFDDMDGLQRAIIKFDVEFAIENVLWEAYLRTEAAAYVKAYIKTVANNHVDLFLK